MALVTRGSKMTFPGWRVGLTPGSPVGSSSRRSYALWAAGLRALGGGPTHSA